MRSRCRRIKPGNTALWRIFVPVLNIWAGSSSTSRLFISINTDWSINQVASYPSFHLLTVRCRAHIFITCPLPSDLMESPNHSDGFTTNVWSRGRYWRTARCSVYYWDSTTPFRYQLAGIDVHLFETLCVPARVIAERQRHIRESLPAGLHITAELENSKCVSVLNGLLSTT